MSSVNAEEMEHLIELISRRVELELAQRNGGQSCECKSSAKNTSVSYEARAPVTPPASAPCGAVAPIIDHTLLKPDATKDELRQVCDEAKKYGFATVCVNSANVGFVARCLQGSSVKPIAVVGFPLGASTQGAKAFETREAIRNGAKEIDMVINIGALKSKDYRLVQDDIHAVVQAAAPLPVKVILETSMLNNEQKIIACALSKAAGAQFVKTSTGFGGGGATPEDIALMRSVVGDDIGVKASGGIRTFDDLQKVVEAGASRVGASSSVAIVQCSRGSSKEPSSKPKRSLY